MDQAPCEACGSLQGGHTLVLVCKVPQANGREVPRPEIMTRWGRIDLNGFKQQKLIISLSLYVYYGGWEALGWVLLTRQLIEMELLLSTVLVSLQQMERKLWSVLHQHLHVLNGSGISFQLNSLTRTNHMVPLNHKGAKECVSVLRSEGWEPKIFGEQCWCLHTIYVSHLHSHYYKILHAHGKYSFT